ncbi:MAG: hypothetical protein ACRCTE_03085 [Cellulosilyticaceae bacterium]
MSNENKFKHMDYVQSTINRMSNNQFIIKGATMATIIPLLGIIMEIYSKAKIAIVPLTTVTVVGVLVCFIFAAIDGFYLSIERKYRQLHNQIRLKKDEDIDFDMRVKFTDLEDVKEVVKHAKSIWPFYLIVGIATTVPLLIQLLCVGVPKLIKGLEVIISQIPN